MLWVCLAVAAVAGAAGVGAEAPACRLEPPGAAAAKSPGDNFYRLIVNGDVERYRPEQRYVVTLVGSRTHDKLQAFARFKLALEPLDGSAAGSPGSPRSPRRLGEFQLFADTMSRFDERCAGAVLAADDLPKTEVQVMWKAPAAGSGCVLLKAMVMENASSWFAEDGQLTRRVCEDTSVNEDCCACDDAKYKMVFEGLWSAQTHPKNFPTQALWLTHFSDVIGATHQRDFSFWGPGMVATDGFRDLAEWGSVGLMERELRQRGGGGALRSIVKAQGLWHPRVNSNTSAAFTVDRKRHLLSLASMFGPSPDWVVGVHGLDLCQADCTWAESRVVDLFPYDAGTDNGVSYMSPNQETVPRERMHRITPMYPEDPRSPFYDPSAAEVPPMARLHVTRDALVSRSCDERALQALVLVAEEQENTQAVNTPECAVFEWGAWSACSVTCGKGLRMRARAYRSPHEARARACDRQLVSKEMCVAAVPECEGDNAAPEASESDVAPAAGGGAAGGGVCATGEWGAWSECSVTCGVGQSMRRRHFLDHMGLKKCPLVHVEESRKCMEPACEAGEGEAVGEAGSDDPACPTTEWSGWSPCSASCGRGVAFRTRLLLVPADRQRECAPRVQLVQQRPCLEREDCTIDMLTAKRICMESAEQGPCRGLYPRWAFVPAKGMCAPFNYGGCRGNRNNFLTRDECADTCRVVLGAAAPGGSGGGAGGQPSAGLSVGSESAASSVNGPAAAAGAGADCRVSAWGEWTRCSVTCGAGYQERVRTVLAQAGPGGAACPARLSRRRRCSRPC